MQITSWSNLFYGNAINFRSYMSQMDNRYNNFDTSYKKTAEAAKL